MEEATLVRFNLAEDFWIKRLKNLSVEKIKPFYPQSQITVDSSTKEVCFKLDDDISKRLLEISNGTDPSIFMLFLSSLSVLLRNYTGSNDICIATSGFINDPREEESSDTLIFLKGELTPDITVKELIDQHLKDLNQVYPHQNFDYESLLTKISDQGENKVGDLHHVGLIYSRFNRPSVFLEDLDLLFDFNLEEGSFLMNVVYKSDIYEITQINQLGRHYINLLKDSLYHSQKSISELSLFSNEDKNEIYSQVSELRNSGDYKKSVIELFEEKVVDFPNQIALVSGQEYITYYQLNKQANQLANFIRREYNVCKGDFIGVLARTTHSYILTILGILKSEAIFVPINPESPEEQNKNIIEQIRPKLIVTDSELMFTLANFYYGEMFALDIQLDQVRNSSEEVIPRTASSNNTIYTVFTSGTTGTPKGVMVQDHALANYALWLTNELSISQKDKSVLLSSISFDLGYTAVWGCLLGGATLHLIEDKIVKTPEYLTDYLVERAITFIKLTPSLFSMMNLADNVAMYEESSLRLVLLGGEKIKVEDIDSFKKYNSEIVFYNHYGPTESTIGCIAEKIAPMDFDAFERCPVIGKPIDNMSCYILNSELEPVPKGVIGELYIGGPGLAQGYLNQEELTNDKFKKSGIGHVEQRVYRSGDLARCLPNGKIEFLGRVDNQVKIDGYRVELGEIRSALNLFESIKDSYVVLKKRHNEPPILAAYVLKDDTEYDDLKEFLKTKLPVYKIPQVFISLAEFPLSPNGKIDTRALPDPSSQLSGRVKIKLPANDLERDIAEIWKEVLGKKEIGVEDNYFELGGNSLKGVIIVNKLKLLLNKFVPVTDLFEFPTIYELAQNIKQELEYKPNQLNKNGKSSSPEGLSGDALEFEIPNLEPSQYYPVSHSQKRLWIVSQFDGEKSAYNQPRVYLLEGELNIDALTRSFECLINRHEILRTSFVAQDGLPMQKIKDVDDVNFKIEFRDLSKEDNREQVLEEMIVGESKMPFNLENGPLMRVKVVKKSDKNHILFLTTHHIISDAWSMQIISKELITYYNQFITGDFNDPFSALKIQYKEYASWQKNLLGSDSGIKQKEYWLSRFQGDIPSLDLPLDFSRPKVRTTRGKTIRRKLSRKSCKGLKKIGTENNASLFMTVLATVNAFFYRYLEKDDISISAPVAGRDHSDLADQVGFYVNNLVIRTEFNGKEDSFMDILESVKVRTQEALRNQSYPYDLLVEELNLTRDLSRTPLYDVVLLVEKMDENAAEQMEGINISGYNTDHTVSWTDLRLSFIETGGEFNFIIDYNVDLFLPERIERMLNYYENLIGSIADNPDTPILECQFLDSAELDLQLNKFNHKAISIPTEETINEAFEKAVQLNKNRVAILSNHMAITYGELNERVNKLAHFIRRNGHVKPNQVACLIMDRSVELIIGILAVLKSGGSYIVIEPDLPASRKAYILKDSETQFILTTSDYLFDIPDQQCELFAIDLQIDSLDESKENPKIINRGTDLAYLIYTSGSTGNPKGVMVEHCGVVNLSNWQSEKFDISSESNVLQMFSYSFDGAVGETFMALLNGATLHQVFLSSISAEKMIEYINDHDVSLGVFVPSFLKQMNKYQTSRPERLTVVSVGEECTLELAEAWRQKCNFVNAYGPTEYTVYSHYYDVSKDAIISKNRSIPIGTSINNTKTYILSSEDKIAPIGVDGQLCISGLGLARGYLNNSDYSFQKFLPNHFFLKEVCKDIGSLEELISPTELEEFRVQCQSKNTVTSANIIKNEYAPEDLLENLHILDEDLQLVVKNILEKYSSDTDSSVYQGYCRYFIEGINDSYQSHGINERIIKHLFPFDSFKNKNGIDFGFGNGEVLRILEELGANVTGLDWNPHFVQKARDLGRSVKVAKIDDTTETFFDQYGIQRESLDFAISTLVLDRLNKPYNLFLNIFESLKVGGYFAIQTLLPIIPEDDGDVTNKIVYTKKENRISPGENIDADKLYVAQILYALGADTINVAHMPYVVSSRDGIQQYTLWSFYGTKSAIGSKVERHKFSQMYKTGDMARYLDDGNIQFSGRKDDQIKLRGFRIEISEIEQVILSYDKIKDGIVTAARQGSEPYLIAYIICEEEGVEDELKNYLISVLPSYMVPSYIINVDCFPLTKSGKIDKNSLPDPTLIKDSSRNIQKPTNATQRHLANLWEQVLGKSGFGIEDNFFALGGHSLMAVKLVSLIGRELELKLDIKDIFDNPTIYLLSQFVDSNVVQKLKSINPVEEQQYYPVSHSQKRLWVLDQLERNQSAYNIPSSYMLFGLDRKVFEESLAHVVKRHDSLRTVFVTIDGEVKQKVLDYKDLKHLFSFTNLTQADDKDIIVGKMAKDDIIKSFNLSEGPLIRLNLIQMEDSDFLLLLNIHHIIADGWSINNLINDIIASYNNISQGNSNVQNSLSLQYKDFTVWQNDFLDNKVEESELFWTSKFKDGVKALNLPIDYARPLIKTFNGDRINFELTNNVYSEIKQTSESSETTFFVVILSLVNIFLHKLTKNEQIILGTPVLGREHIDLESQIGFYVNTILLKNEINSSDDFSSILQDVKTSTHGAFAHQSYPFDLLVEKVAPQWNLSRNSPLFDVLITYQERDDHPEKNTEMNNVVIEPYKTGTYRAKFDLSFDFIVNKDTISVSIGYNTDIFSKNRIHTMKRYFLELIDQVFGFKQNAIADLNMYNELEYELINICDSVLSLPNGSIGIDESLKNFLMDKGDELAQDISESLNIKLKARDLFNYDTVAKLTNYIEQERNLDSLDIFEFS